MKKELLAFVAVSTIIYAGGDIAPVEDIPVMEEEVVGFNSIGIFAGSFGIGASYSTPLAYFDSTAIKFSISGINSVSPSFDDDNVHYEADVDLFDVGLTLDYHPFGTGFYLSAGAFYNHNKVGFNATPRNGTYTINDNVYLATDIDYVNGRTNFNKFVPYIGIGYDNSLFGDGNWFFTAKLGVIYQGSPDVKLGYRCGTTATATLCNQIANDVLEAEKSLNDKIDKYRFYPDLSIGISYRF